MNRDELLAASVPWRLRADLPFEQPVVLALDAAALAASIVRFELPPGGPLEVRVRELDGTPAPRGSSLRLRLLGHEELHELDLGGPEWTGDLQDGAVSYPWVELARDWELCAWRPQGSEPTRLRSRGPVRLGEGVMLELVLGSDHPVVSYRALSPAREPLASTELDLIRWPASGSRDTSKVATDARGRFTLDGRANFILSRDFRVEFQGLDDVLWMARGHLPSNPVNGWNDGGDLVLAPSPRMCAGRVVDAAGEAIVDADVIAGEERFWFDEGDEIRAKSDARGIFELRGLAFEETFHVWARRGNARSAEVSARQGDDDLVLTLTPRFSISGEFVLDPGVDSKAVRFALERPRGVREELGRKREAFVFSARHAGVRHPAPARFALEPIEGGPLDLLFLLDGAEIARRAGLVLSADLELGSVDLRGRISTCEIELVGDDGMTGLAGEYDWGPSGEERRHDGSFRGTRVSLCTPRVPIDVELRPRGYRLALLEGLSGSRQLVLEPALRVRLVLQTSGTLPPPPFRFDAELYRGEAAVSHPTGPRWFTPQRREIECLVATPGQLVARWHLEKGVDGQGFGGAIGSHVLEPHWVTLDVRDEPGVQVFTLALDSAALEGVTQGLDW